MNDKIKTYTLSLILSVSLIVGVKGSVSAGTGGDGILSSLLIKSKSLQFTIDVPWEELVLEEVLIEGTAYTKVQLPGWSTITDPGAPSLPYWSTAIGVPLGAQLALQVTPGKSRTLTLPAPLVPVPSTIIPWDDPDKLIPSNGFPQPVILYQKDQDIYSQGSSYPSELGRVMTDGFLRHQRVASIGFFPFHYHPTASRITIYETVEVRVSFEGNFTVRAKNFPTDSDQFEILFKNKLINYEQALPWRQNSTESYDNSSSNGAEFLINLDSMTPWIPPDPGWRINLVEEGFYELTYAELDAVGLPVDELDPDTLQLFNLGSEVAINFLGDSDNMFETDESVLFYGQAIENKYTKENVYWLTYDQENQTSGKRMIQRDVTPSTGAEPSFYNQKLIMEENYHYISGAPGEDDFERFFWTYVYATSGPTSWTHSFNLISPHDGSGILTISMLGYLSYTEINPDHHVIIYLDNALIDETQISEAWWDGKNWQNLEITIPAGLLAPGANSIRIECPKDTGGSLDLVYIDKIEIEYPKTFSADANHLAFTYQAPSTWQYTISGFTSPPQALFDITDPYNVERLTGFLVSGSGNDTLTFEDTISEPTSYWVMGDGSMRTDEIITMDQPSNWQELSNGADYILISPQVFQVQAQVLTDHRQNQGLRTELVLLQDVYDEFKFGLADANAIHDFLKYAYTFWQSSPPPTYVVLVGDGHYDPKDYMGYGRISFFPPFLKNVDPWINETAADNRFVTISGDDTMPDMQIGRLSVNSSAEAEAFINKIIAYETSLEPGDWQQAILAVADNADSAGNFAFLSDSIINNHIPNSYNIDRVYMGVTHYTESDAAQALRDQFNMGKLFINYIGHASYLGWASEYLLTPDDIPALINGSKTPVILAMTCYDGYFHYPYNNREVLSEVSTRADGRGSVASWSPSGLGVANGHGFLNQGFYGAIFEDGLTTLGSATTGGKFDLWVSGGNLDLLDTYTLFGDPATNLAITIGEQVTIYFPLINH